MRFEVRNEARVFFRHDTWHGDQLLKVQFPNFFYNGSFKRHHGAQCFFVERGTQHHWDITFTRSSNDCEEKSIISLLSLLADLYAVGLPKGDDKIIWFLNSSGIFSVKSLCERMLGSNHPIFSVNAIRKSKALTKACFLVWTASNGKVPALV